MALTPRLDLRTTQTLVMTPQLQQAIKLLQMSNLELTAYVEQQLEQNPLLEREDLHADRGANEAGEGNSEGPPDAADAPPATDTTDTSELTRLETPAVDDGPLDADFDNVWTNDSIGDSAGSGGSMTLGERRGGSGDIDGDYNLEQTLSSEISLRDHLIDQLNVDLDPVDRIIGVHLLDLLDETGYMTGDLASVATQLGCPLPRVEGALAQMQRFDPPGVFARNLSECLAIQLRDRNRLDPAMQLLLDNLNLIAQRDAVGLMRICGVDADDLTDMITEIRALNPKPALAFDHTVAQPVTPDVLMFAKTGGGWRIELNTDTLPRVLVNNTYYADVSAKSSDRKTKEYLTNCIQSANWLVKSLHQRATTILRVSAELVSQQDGFFQKGVQHLRPLILRDIATAIDMHESTVSRVTTNKFIATPRGIFELKYFFSSSVASSTGGEALSAESVRSRIKQLIDKESHDDVLSDDRIVAILLDQGVDVARRTVAKYRDALRIPSSVQRRRDKSARLVF